MRVAVAGLGLIGGSVALAARDRLGAEVYGSDPDPSTLRDAFERQVVVPGPDDAEPDIVVVAAPVGVLREAITNALAAWPNAVITDVGSTKAELATAGFGRRYIGGHPLAGAEVSGLEHARADLFEGATWYLTPNSETEGVLLERVHRFVTGLGAKPISIDADEHDRLMAAFSHLPHVLANVLVSQGAGELGDEVRPVVGPSFRDATRVAGANPQLWADIYAANGDALVSHIDGAIAALQDVRARIAAGDITALRAWQQAAADAGARLADQGVAGGPIEEIRVIVPNRPGVIADIALALGRAGISIQDMSLRPESDNRSGEIALWVAAEHAGQARALVAATMERETT